METRDTEGERIGAWERSAAREHQACRNLAHRGVFSLRTGYFR